MARDKSIKNDGSYLFADFSRGLYLLDTPRFITEQLASLALVDGRNVWAEKGALVPQYGYELRAKLPPAYQDEETTLPPRVIAFSKGDTSNDDFMILANEYLESFNPSAFTLVGSPTITNDGIASGFSENDYIVTPSIDRSQPFVQIMQFTTGSTVSADEGLFIEDTLTTYKSRIQIRSGGTLKLFLTSANTGWDIANENGHTVLTANTSYYLKFSWTGTQYKVELSTDGENYSTDITVNSSTALRDLPMEIGKQGLVPFEGTMDLSKIKIISDDEEIFSGSIDVEKGAVYEYSASQGLKKFKTALAYSWSDPIIARRGKDLCIYDNGEFRLWGGNYIAEAQDEILIGTYSLLSYTTYAEFTCSSEDAVYFWNGKQVLINGNEYTVSACYKDRGLDTYTVRMYRTDGSAVDSGSQSIYECTTWAPTIVYEPDNTGIDPPFPDVALVPRAMGVANNRLFIEHTDGNIYYSAIGRVNDFDQINGAGYFGGFYNDTTKLLSIEDFLSGALITKENGMYYLTISDSSGVQQVNIEKISQVGQTYASDHVIVGEKVYAYDKNTGSIVNAISMNVFGSLVAGKPLVTSEYLNVQNFNITTVKRALVYNAEARILILYYGDNLKNGVVYTMDDGRLFPRELDKNMSGYIGFNQGDVGVCSDGSIIQDFRKGTIIPNLSCIASFEPIGVRDNRLIISSILEVTELNGVNYNVTTVNAGTSFQKIMPSFYVSSEGLQIPPFIYSDASYQSDSFELTSRWAEQNSHLTRMYAPMSGRAGVSISLEFEPDKAFILSSLRLPDFSQGN